MKFRKKPEIVIEARQLLPGTVEDLSEWMGPKCAMVHDGMVIETGEGDMIATYGDWIIQGVENEFYPCKMIIFEATYEKIGEVQFDDPEGLEEKK